MDSWSNSSHRGSSGAVHRPNGYLPSPRRHNRVECTQLAELRAAAWTNLEDMMFSEISQSQNYTYHTIPL